MIQAFQQPGMLQSVIQSGRDIDFELPDGKTALMLASEQGNASAVRQLLAAGAAPNARSRNGGTALMYAASIGSNAVIRTLLQSGSAVNSMNVEGKTALMAAAGAGMSRRCASCWRTAPMSGPPASMGGPPWTTLRKAGIPPSSTS